MAIEADGSEEIGVDGVLPVRVAESQHAPTRRGRSADIVDQDVHAAKTVRYFPEHLVDALGHTDVSLHEPLHRLTFRQRRACGGGHGRAGGGEAPHDGLAHALGAAGDEGTLAGEFGRIERELRRPGHGRISRRAIFSPASAKA